ncbi:hypothetical protein ACQKFG_09545 [Peribacillus sp. NPDC076916]
MKGANILVIGILYALKALGSFDIYAAAYQPTTGGMEMVKK